MRTLNSIDHFKRTIDRRFFYPIPGSKIVLCTDRDFEKRLVALYVFAWLVFATFPLSLSLAQAKGFLRISTPFTGTRQNMQINRKEFFIYFSSSHSLTWRKCLTWYTADHHSAVRKIPWDWESAERRRLFSAQSLGVLCCPFVRAKSGKRWARESLSVTSHLTSRERLELRLSYFLRIRVYCCCCRRCYCWWCLLSCWGRAKSQGRLVTRVVSVQKLICFLCPWISKFTSAFDCNNSCGWSPFK